MGQIAVVATPEEVWVRLRRDWLVVFGVDDDGERGKTHFAAEGKWRADSEKLRFTVVGREWFALVAQRREQLTRYASEHALEVSSAPMVMIADSDPADFLAGFWAALLSGWNITLANAQWGHQEWQSASSLIQPQIVWHNFPNSPSPLFSASPDSPTAKRTVPAILIPTGGSSGQLKFAHHTWQPLPTSVTGFHQHFFPTSPSLSDPSSIPVNAYCTLPLYHVSGLLQALRTALSNGQLFLLPFKALLLPSFPLPPVTKRCQSHSVAAGVSFISLVPTQLSRLLNANKASCLSRFHAVLLGGAPPWPSLLECVIAHKIPLCLSYGMTETAAMVSATDPQTILQGKPLLGSGRAMPHAKIKIERAGQSLPGQSLPVGEVGQVVVYSDAIAICYHNAPSLDFAQDAFYTDDLGYLDADANLHITGRASGKIISGGENIFPTEVEAALRNTGQVRDVCVIGLPHSTWGEAVSAAYVPVDETVSPESLKAALVEADGEALGPVLSRYKIPKHWCSLPHLPRNEQGKINRSRLITTLLAQQKTLSSPSVQQLAADDGESAD
ncbi:MAG: AMP-binding protein [Phormidesmis sp.]